MDDFFAVPCTIKHKKNTEESLVSLVQGEVLDGDNKYHCDKCDAKVAAIKRTCIQTLPRHLILHLKRIDFDMELLERRKINDVFSFEAMLDMYPYTLEGLTAAEHPEQTQNDCSPRKIMYRLKGILIHR